MELKQDVRKLTKQIKAGEVSLFDRKIDEAIVERFKIYEQIGARIAENKQTEEDKIFSESMKMFFDTLKQNCKIALENQIYGKKVVENRFCKIIEMSSKCGEYFKKGYSKADEQVL